MSDVYIQAYLTNVALYSGVVAATVEVLKKAAGEYLPDRFYPLVSLVLGVVLGMVFAELKFIPSLIIGLVASGSYKVVKETVAGVIERL